MARTESTRGSRTQVTTAARPRRKQRGYLMAGLVASVAILMIFSTLAFQAWIDVLRRDNEAEMMFRAQDLVRAIQRYRRDHGGVGPMKLEQLMEPGTRNQYYLRQLWKDPLVRDGKWGLLYAGPNGQIVDPNAPLPTGEEGNLFGHPGEGQSPGGGFGSNQPGSLQPGGLQPGTQQPGVQPGLPGAQPGQPGAFPGIGEAGPGDDEHAGGKQLSGLPIAGVKSLCTETPFRVYNGLTDYSQWLFTYFDLERPQLPGANRPPGARGGLQPQGLQPLQQQPPRRNLGKQTGSGRTGRKP